MRISMIAPLLLLISTFAFAADDAKLNAEYAGNAAKLFAKIESREKLVELLKAVTKPSDQKLLEEQMLGYKLYYLE